MICVIIRDKIDPLIEAIEENSEDSQSKSIESIKTQMDIIRLTIVNFYYYLCAIPILANPITYCTPAIKKTFQTAPS